MNKVFSWLIFVVGLGFSLPVFAGGPIVLEGRVVDQLSGQPIAGAVMMSAYMFSPESVVTDIDGRFSVSIDSDFVLKEGTEKGKKDTGGSWVFSKECYDYAQFSIRKDSVSAKKKLTKDVFDEAPVSMDVVGNRKTDMGDLKMYPMASLVIENDAPTLGVFVTVKSKRNGETLELSGKTSGEKRAELSYSLPVNYETNIVGKDAYTVQWKSDPYIVPREAHCKNVILEYDQKSGSSHWEIEGAGFFDSFIQWFVRYFFS